MVHEAAERDLHVLPQSSANFSILQGLEISLFPNPFVGGQAILISWIFLLYDTFTFHTFTRHAAGS